MDEKEFQNRTTINENMFYNNICSKFSTVNRELRSFNSSGEFVNEFKDLFSSPQAKSAKGVIYFWRSQKTIPRIRGRSYLLYIGQTKQTLKDRHYRYAKTEANDYNWPRYEYILENYGPITVHYADPSMINPQLNRAEEQMLEWYFKLHHEYPPLNRASR